RLGEPEFLGGLGKAQFFGDSDKVAQVAKFHFPEHREGHSQKLSQMLGQEMAFSELPVHGARLRIVLGYSAVAGEVLAGSVGRFDLSTGPDMKNVIIHSERPGKTPDFTHHGGMRRGKRSLGAE
ncbi:MAG TPA: hypothetical protein VIT23_03060, partial [Terrimicrobiaceae bacterium]